VSRLRLLKVMIQAIFVLDDGDELTEMSAQPLAVRAGDWPTFATTRFVEGAEALAMQIGAELYVPASTPTSRAT